MLHRAKVNLKSCEDDLSRVLRLATYRNGEMKRAWDSIFRTPVADSTYHPDFAGAEHLAFTIIFMINEAVNKFNSYPKRTASERKKALFKISQATENLVRAISNDAEAHAEEIDILHEYIWSRGRRIEGGPLKPEERFPDQSSLRGVLIFYRDRIDLLAKQKSPLVQSNRGDQGMKPYLIRELSTIMHSIFQQPLDNVVALLASAILDLDQPLMRDDVRPYLKNLRDDLL